MLGVVKNPTFTDADRIIKEVADDMGVGDTFVPTPVGVFFGPDGDEDAGQDRARPVLRRRRARRAPAASNAARCMTGCRYGAKNTLVKNYLGLAETAGAASTSDDHGDRLRAAARRAVGGPHRAHRRLAAPQAAHVHRRAGGAGRRHVRHPEAAVQDARQGQAAQAVRQARRADPHQLRVDRRRRDASRSRRDLDLTHGVAITSSIHPTSDTHIEPVRYGKGSNAMGLLQTLMTDGAGPRGHRRAAVEAAACSRPARIREACCGCSTRGGGASAR